MQLVMRFYNSQLIIRISTPIELIWAKIKGQVATENTTFKIADVTILTHKALSQVDKDYWRRCSMHVEKEGQIYWKQGGLRFIQPETVINIYDADTVSETDED